MFKFGENWASFSRQLDEEHIEKAVASLKSLFGEDALKDKSFLDIGCGSGLFSIAAARLGARPIIGIDVDPISVDISCTNFSHWLDDHQTASFSLVSVLDDERMRQLGTFDVVYSWGVLHHTGNMAMASANLWRVFFTLGFVLVLVDRGRVVGFLVFSLGA